LLLEALGCQPHFINDEPTGVYTHPPEPLRENLGELTALTAARGAAIGFAQDPDADRLALVDSEGRYIGEEYTLALAAMSYLDALPAHQRTRVALATNLSTSRMIDDVAEQYGATVERTPVGEANLVEWMLPNGSPLGGEGNGGVIWPDVVPIRDSLSAMALTLALMARTGQTLADLVDDMPAYAIVKRKAPFDPAALDRLDHALSATFPEAAANTADGVRLDLTADDGGKAWLHVRPSNTEPILRLIAEAPTRERAEALLDHAARALGL
jgi:phosphomannomutase